MISRPTPRWFVRQCRAAPSLMDDLVEGCCAFCGILKCSTLRQPAVNQQRVCGGMAEQCSNSHPVLQLERPFKVAGRYMR